MSTDAVLVRAHHLRPGRRFCAITSARSYRSTYWRTTVLWTEKSILNVPGRKKCPARENWKSIT